MKKALASTLALSLILSISLPHTTAYASTSSTTSADVYVASSDNGISGMKYEVLLSRLDKEETYYLSAGQERNVLWSGVFRCIIY